MNGLHVAEDSQVFGILSEDQPLADCQACAAFGLSRPAVGRSTHPEYRHVNLCVECIALYDSAKLEAVDVVRSAYVRE